MSITIPISARSEDVLRERAAARGQDLVQYASELLEQALDRMSGEGIAAQPLSSAQWAARSQAFLTKMNEYAKRLPVGHMLDDSRESIYAGRGE